ncbi:MAG: ATP-grasp fold amidoligase family protein [Oscillospiraceae bacterium]
MINQVKKLKYMLKILPDPIYLKIYYFFRLKKLLNIKTPKSFNEKLQWLKLNDRNPLYTVMVDKVKAKKYVADIIGEEYIIPTLGVWDSPDKIDLNQLPEQFVLKCNHGSGDVFVCKNKAEFNFEHVKKKLRKLLKEDYYLIGREWPYKNVSRKIIAEKYMEDKNTAELCDYKFFCFNEVPKYCQVICNRSTNETIDFFDMEWNHQEFTGLSLPNKPFSNNPISIPIQFEKMKEFASILAKDIPFVRIDFYEVNGDLYFGEITLYPAGGFGVFTPDEWNLKLGEYINLSEGGYRG